MLGPGFRIYDSGFVQLNSGFVSLGRDGVVMMAVIGMGVKFDDVAVDEHCDASLIVIVQILQEVLQSSFGEA